MDSLRSLLAKNPVIKACFERESGQTDQNVEPVNIVILISETENAHPHAISAKGTITDRKKVVGKYISDINEHSSFINLDLKVEGLIEKGEKESTIALRILPGDSTDAPGFTIQIQGTLDNIKFDWIHIQNVEISLGEMNNPVGTTALNPDSEGAENPQESENKDLDLANMLQAVEAPQEDLDLANMLSVFEIPQEPEGRDLSFIQLMEPNLGTSASGNLGLSDMLSPGFGDGEFEDWTFKSDYNWTFAPDDDWTFAPDYNYANRELLPYSHLMEAPASNYGYSFYPLTTGTAYSQIPSLEPHTDYGQPAVNAEIAPTRGSDNKDNDEPLASFHGTPEDDSECVTVKLNDDGATPYLSSKTGNISLSSTFTSTSRGIHNDPDIISAGCQVSHTTPVSQQVPMTDSVNKIQESGNPELQTIDQIMDVTPPLMAVETSVQAQIVIPLPITVKISDLAQGVIPYLQIPARVQSVASRPKKSTQDVGLPLRALKISDLAPNMAPPLVKTGEQKLKNKRVHTNTKISDLAQDVALDSVKSKRSTQQSVASRPKKSTQDVGLPLMALEISALPEDMDVTPFPKGMTFHPVKKNERKPKNRNEVYAAICHYIEEDLLDYCKTHNRSLQDIINDPAGPGELNKLASTEKRAKIHGYLNLMHNLVSDYMRLLIMTCKAEKSQEIFRKINRALGVICRVSDRFQHKIKYVRTIESDPEFFQIIFLLEDYFIPIQLEKILVVYEENIKEPKHTITSGSRIEKLFKNIYVQIYKKNKLSLPLQNKFTQYIKGFDLHIELGPKPQQALMDSVSQTSNIKLPSPESENPVSKKPCSRKRKSPCIEGTNDAKRSKSNDAKPGSKQVSTKRTVKKTKKKSNLTLIEKLLWMPSKNSSQDIISSSSNPTQQRMSYHLPQAQESTAPHKLTLETSIAQSVDVISHPVKSGEPKPQDNSSNTKKRKPKPQDNSSNTKKRKPNPLDSPVVTQKPGKKEEEQSHLLLKTKELYNKVYKFVEEDTSYYDAQSNKLSKKLIPILSITIIQILKHQLILISLFITPDEHLCIIEPKILKNQEYFKELCTIIPSILELLTKLIYYGNGTGVYKDHTIPSMMCLLEQCFIPNVLKRLYLTIIKTSPTDITANMSSEELLKLIYNKITQSLDEELKSTWKESFRFHSMPFINCVLSNNSSESTYTYYISLTEYMYDYSKSTYDLTSTADFNMEGTAKLLRDTVSELDIFHSQAYENIKIIKKRIHSRVNAILHYNGAGPESQDQIKKLWEIVHTKLIPLIMNQILDELDSSTSHSLSPALSGNAQMQRIISGRRDIAAGLVQPQTIRTAHNEELTHEHAAPVPEPTEVIPTVLSLAHHTSGMTTVNPTVVLSHCNHESWPLIAQETADLPEPNRNYPYSPFSCSYS